MFRRHADQCVARFAADEVAVLRQVASEVIGLLTENFDRDDPVVERLFPDGYADNPAEAAEFEKDVGRRATAAEIYCIHQQGYQGCAFHYTAPHQLAWKNMYLTTEGREKGEAWARKAIWGNVPSDLKNKIKGGLDALTSGQFIALWTERVNRFMARRVEPPTHYVQHAAKAKKPTKAAATDKERTKVAASN